MTIKFGGILHCDVCGDPIMWTSGGDQPHKFQDPKIRSPKGNIVELHAHENPCKQRVEYASKKKDWKALPPGPLRSKYEEAIMQSHFKKLKNQQDGTGILARDEIVPIEAD